jgi:drug/metabolite transporter (DMT)-like permease
MAAFLAIISAALFGAGDFLGGLASRRTGIFSVIAIAQLIGLFVILLVAPFMADQFLLGDFFRGSLAGILGLIGISLIFHALQRGPMTIVAPITSIASAVIPVIWGTAHGENLSSVHILGISIGMTSIYLISQARDQTLKEKPTVTLPPWLITESLLSGLCFAGFYIVIDGTSISSEPWPLVGARSTTVCCLLLIGIFSRRALRVDSSVLPLIFWSGALDTIANLTFLMATNRGMLSIVSVLTSLYPAATVVLAKWILKEHLTRIQVLGLLGALTATALIASG